MQLPAGYYRVNYRLYPFEVIHTFPESIVERYSCRLNVTIYLRCYQTNMEVCASCMCRSSCLDRTSKRRRILASSCYPAFYRGRPRAATGARQSMMRLRKIWIEGCFAVMKREHLIPQIRKRGISRAYEECLLSALALNLKRMVHAVCFHILGCLRSYSPDSILLCA